jgi:hypothetical protein
MKTKSLVAAVYDRRGRSSQSAAMKKAGRGTPCAPLFADDHHAAAERRGLTCPAIPFRPGLEQDTQLMPWLIAETVCEEVSQFLDVELPARYAVWLDAKAELCYGGHRHFRKLMRGRGNAPRDWLYVFMRHWLASILHLERPDLCRCLPVEFCCGKRLQRGTHPRINRAGSIRNFLPAPCAWDDSRVIRHHTWAWLTGIGMERGRVEPSGQKRSGQSGVGGQFARGDDPDHRADRAEVAPGNPEHFEHKPSREKRHE